MTPPEVEGVLPVDKPVGPTSHDIIAAARRALRQRRIGHTGTLDPFASGLLLLLLGRATRLAEYFADLPKRYTATAHLGVATDTEDRTGQIVATSDAWRGLAPDRVRAAFESMAGERMQRPPAFSAKKVAGERAYAAARRGDDLALQPVPIRIDSLRVTGLELPLVTFEVTCSTGTYVRSIARDAGDDLGVFGHLAELRRTGIGPWEA
jgi:tRNA pseudouridine55 synthase